MEEKVCEKKKFTCICQIEKKILQPLVDVTKQLRQ